MTDALSTQWNTITSTYPSAAPALKLAVLNSMMVSGPTADVDVAQVGLYLAAEGKLAGLMVYAQKAYASIMAGTSVTPAQVAAAQFWSLLQIPNFVHFTTSIGATYTTIQNMLTLVASDGASGLTNDDVESLLGLATRSVYWWQANGYSAPITMAQITAAGLS